MNTLITLFALGYVALSAWIISYCVKRFSYNNFAREFWIVMGLTAFFLTMPFPIMADLGVIR